MQPLLRDLMVPTDNVIWSPRFPSHDPQTFRRRLFDRQAGKLLGGVALYKR